MLLVLAPALVGCPRQARLGGQTPVDVVIDDLRRDNLELRQQVEQLNANIEQRLQHIQVLEQQLERAGESPVVAGATVPHFVSVRFDRYSGFLDTTHDDKDDTLRLYVQTLDQDGRFIPIAARVVVQAVVIRPEQPPLVIVQHTFEPDAFLQAYRSGFMGTHYTLELPLPADLAPDIDSAAVQISVTDVAGGATAKREATMRIAR
jgi:hypothetical protein